MMLSDRWRGFSPSPCVTLVSQFGEVARTAIRIVGIFLRGCWLSDRFQSAFAGPFPREVIALIRFSLFVRLIEPELLRASQPSDGERLLSYWVLSQDCL